MEDTTPVSVARVFADAHLLHLIASKLALRARLALGGVDHACRQAVDSPHHWAVVAWRGVGPPAATGRAVSYAEAARRGNALCAVLRAYGRHVRQLRLAACPWLQVTGLEDIARCRQLRVLDVSGCSGYSVDLLGQLVRHCPHLVSLLARGCSRICEPAIVQELWDAPPGQRLNLAHLDLQGVMFRQDAEAAVVGGGMEGQAVVFDAGADLGRAVERLACDRLVSLRLGGIGEAGPAATRVYVGDLSPALRVAAQCGASLRVLDLPGCTVSAAAESCLPAALASASALRALCLSHWSGGPASLAGLAECPATRLTALNLRGASALADAHLLPLLAANPRLASLNVGCCGRLSDAVLRALPAACPDLEALDVCYAGGMSAEGVRALIGRLPRLAEFGFSGVVGLGDADVVALVAAAPGMRMLGIGGIPRLTDAALCAVASRCAATLVDLYAADLPNISPGGLAALLAACTALRRVCVRSCRGLGGEEAVAALLRARGLARAYMFEGDLLRREEVARAVGGDEEALPWGG